MPIPSEEGAAIVINAKRKKSATEWNEREQAKRVHFDLVWLFQ